MTIIEIGNYRLQSISQIGKGELPISKGIALERKHDTDDFYYVVLFIQWDSSDETVYYDCVDTRLDKIEVTEWELVKDLLECGSKLVALTHKV